MPAASASFFRDFLARFRRGNTHTDHYRAYTKQFDRIVDAADLPLVLGRLSPEDAASLDQAWAAMQHGLLPWKTPLLIEAADAATRIRAAMDAEQRRRTAITLLVDQSGSMRGQKMLFTAAAVDLAQECLASLKMQVEVLGFTTIAWRGGRARKTWLSRGQPAHPGRLNDLLHVIYRPGDDTRASAAGFTLRPMLRPDLLKENVDGEALQWAAGRLAARDADRRLLIMLSDGAPVDDSTLAANGPHYLTDHLREVIATIEHESEIELGAVGIGFDVDRFYPRATSVEGADALGGTLLDFAETMILRR